MATAIQGYMPAAMSETMPTPGFFTSAIADDENLNLFDASFKEGSSNMDANNEQSETQYRGQDGNRTFNQSYFRPINDETYSPAFGFSPRLSPAPLRTNNIKDQVSEQSTGNLAPSTLWNSSRPEKHLQLSNRQQEKTPPQSLDNSPDQWTFGQYQEPMQSPLHHLLAEQRATSASRFGQVTPPEDGSPVTAEAEGLLDYGAPLTQIQQPQQADVSELPNKGNDSKRKRTRQASQGDTANDVNPPKRQRKPSTRSKSETTDYSGPIGDGEDDAKRSKFLERNRVAASKCRQKKKEWTNNLESRARDLQNNKNQLSMIVGSLRDEVLYLKGELLKHSGCGCSSIRDYLNREVSNLARPELTQFSSFGTGPSSLGLDSAPSSRSASTSDLSRRDSLLLDSKRESQQAGSMAGSPNSANGTSKLGSPSQPSAVEPKSEEDLRALLSAQLAGEAHA